MPDNFAGALTRTITVSFFDFRPGGGGGHVGVSSSLGLDLGDVSVSVDVRVCSRGLGTNGRPQPPTHNLSPVTWDVPPLYYKVLNEDSRTPPHYNPIKACYYKREDPNLCLQTLNLTSRDPPPQPVPEEESLGCCQSARDSLGRGFSSPAGFKGLRKLRALRKRG